MGDEEDDDGFFAAFSGDAGGADFSVFVSAPLLFVFTILAIDKIQRWVKILEIKMYPTAQI